MNKMWYLSLLTILCLSAYGAEDYVWIEGESMSKGDLSDKHHNVSRHKNLSGGVSFGSNDAKIRKAEWDFEMPASGEWHVYVRKFWKHGPFKWRVNGGEFQELTKKKTQLLDNMGLGREHQGINWVFLGRAEFKKGSNNLYIESLEDKGAFVIDCFCISKNPFEPSGLKKPGEKLGLADKGTWAFEPDYDSFEKEDALGLRSLNEKRAGESGYISSNSDGQFVDGKGKEIRFWCTQGGLHRGPGTEALRNHAKHLAKRGINMYRHHGHFNADAKGDPMATRESEIDAAQKMVAVMAEEGIYSTVSLFWATHSEGGKNWGIKAHNGGKLTGLVFWHPDMQKIYRKWWKDVLTRPNPYHPKKTPLGKDPALAIIQLQNEDSLFFHTIKSYGKDKAKLALMQSYFDKWLKEKGYPATKINLKLWELDNPKDEHCYTMQFFAETMYNFNRDTQEYLRKELGCKALINAGNWKTANQTKLLDLERWSYTANEVIGNNRYVNGNGDNGGKPHFSPTGRQGYQVNVGDTFQDHSCLTFPRKLATNAKLVKGHPYIISESTWVAPMSYQSEGPFLIAAYSSLTGMDCYYWFALGSIGYDKGIKKWQAANPAMMGGWPAASLMFRKGYIKQGEPAVYEERALEGDMWKLRSPIIVEEAGFDANRDASVSPLSSVKSGVPALAYLVGPVEVKYDGNPKNSKVADFDQYIKGDVVTSITGELSYDKATGLCTLDAPKAQGVTGFLSKAGQVNTADLSIDSKNDYATVLAVSVDGEDLSKSKKVFLQITTVCRPYGWKESPATMKGGIKAKKIDSVGQAPYNVWDTKMSITLNNRKLKTATLLDENLYPTDKTVEVKSSGGKLSMTLPNNAMYIMLE